MDCEDNLQENLIQKNKPHFKFLEKTFLKILNRASISKMLKLSIHSNKRRTSSNLISLTQIVQEKNSFENSAEKFENLSRKISIKLLKYPKTQIEKKLKSIDSKDEMLFLNQQDPKNPIFQKLHNFNTSANINSK